MGLYMYDSIRKEGDFHTRYHAFTLANEGSDNDYPGEWWSEVYGWNGSDGFLSEHDAFKFLEENYPGRSYMVQQVHWVAETGRMIQRLKPDEERRAHYEANREARANGTYNY